MSQINNVQTDNSKGIDAVMSMNNFIEYSNNYLKIYGCLWQYYIDELPLTDAGVIDKFSGNSTLFKVTQEITEKTGDDGKKGVEIMVQLKHLGNFQRTLEMPLINREINLILTWSGKFFYLMVQK